MLRNVLKENASYGGDYLYNFLLIYPFETKGRHFYKEFLKLISTYVTESTLENVPIYLISVIFALGNLISDHTKLEFGQ